MAGRPIHGVCLVGPTGAGKTDMAVELARRFPFAVISVDSAMVYRYMDIGTAKPDPALRTEIPHAMIDIRDPWESYSAGEFCADATALIEEQSVRGKIPLLVGGTLLYFRALQHGLAPLPQADPEIRRGLDEQAAREGWPALHRELARVDPEAAARIEPGDRHRIQRALEVYRITGESITALQKLCSGKSGYHFLRLALVPGDRCMLYERIERRFARMMATGFLAEVERLKAMPEMSGSPPAMRAVGYRQLWQYLEGETDRPEAERRAVVATRRYAKRQLTWLRADSGDLQLDCLQPAVAGRVCRLIEDRGLFDAI